MYASAIDFVYLSPSLVYWLQLVRVGDVTTTVRRVPLGYTDIL